MNYKQVILLMVLGLNISLKIVSCEHSEVTIIDYHASKKDEVLDICLQDPYMFFHGHKANRTVAPPQDYITRSKVIMERIFDDPLRVKKILMHGKKVAGYVDFCKSREADESKEFALIGSLAVSKNMRGKGYGRVLTKVALEHIRTSWPEIKKAKLIVNAFNTVARRLYESEGFSPLNQTPPMIDKEYLEYEKGL